LRARPVYDDVGGDGVAVVEQAPRWPPTVSARPTSGCSVFRLSAGQLEHRLVSPFWCPFARGAPLCGQNTSVTDVPIYVALITGVAGAVGAAIPQFFTFLGDSHQAGQDRKERGVNAKRQAYVELLGAAADLRTRVANTAMYQPGAMPDRPTEIRSCAADVQVQASKVAFVAAEVAESALGVGSAATKLAAEAISETDRADDRMPIPDFTAFDGAVDKFKAAALAETGK
jgi:hypothetical protein